MNVVGGVAGLVTCLAVFVWGGEYKRQVDVTTADVEVIKRVGSPSLQSHEKLDDNRVGELNRRVTRLEDLLLDIGVIKTTVAVMDKQQLFIVEQLKDIQDQVTILGKTMKP